MVRMFVPSSVGASMKVPPKRKGNPSLHTPCWNATCLNESPSEKEGKLEAKRAGLLAIPASMKVPPKRKGNADQDDVGSFSTCCLNESPSEKEGKWSFRGVVMAGTPPQ